jgi:hypothetical protein
MTALAVLLPTAAQSAGSALTEAPLMTPAAIETNTRTVANQ